MASRRDIPHILRMAPPLLLVWQAAAPVRRVQRMIREAEASTTVEEDSNCNTDSDASTSEAEESGESEAESEAAAAPKPRGRPSKAASKATKVAAKEKKPVVRGGRGMAGTARHPPAAHTTVRPFAR